MCYKHNTTSRRPSIKKWLDKECISLRSNLEDKGNPEGAGEMHSSDERGWSQGNYRPDIAQN